MRFTEILFWGSKSSLRRIAPYGLPGEKRSGALNTAKTKENRCLVPNFRACGAV